MLMIWAYDLCVYRVILERLKTGLKHRPGKPAWEADMKALGWLPPEDLTVVLEYHSTLCFEGGLIILTGTPP